VGISAGAFIAVNFGFAHGSAGILFTASLDFYKNWLGSKSGGIAITMGILVWGEVCLLGISSSFLRILLRIEYRRGAMTGYGLVSLTIRICWCVKIEVRRSVVMKFIKGSSTAAMSNRGTTISQALEADFANAA